VVVYWLVMQEMTELEFSVIIGILVKKYFMWKVEGHTIKKNINDRTVFGNTEWHYRGVTNYINYLI